MVKFMIIKIKDKLNVDLDFNKFATDFIDELNQIDELNFILDFEGVRFISMSFAQAYYASKKRSPKNISEINFSDDVKPMMEMVENKLIS